MASANSPELKKRGFEPIVIFLMSSGEDCEVLNNLQKQGINCKTFLRKKYTEENIILLLKILKSNPPDVFIPNLSVPAYYAAKWVKEAGIPTIGIIRSDDNFHHELIDYFASGNPDYRLTGLVCKSKFLEEIVLSKNIKNFKVLQSPSGTIIPQNIAKEPIDDLKLIYTGRLVQRQKRIFDVLNSLSIVIKQIPNTYVSFYGPDRESGKVIERIDSLNLGERLTYNGILSFEEIYPTLQKNHVFVLLSDYEGMSTSLMEAMACGLVPICTKTRSGSLEIIKHDVNGLLVENRDEDFINAVKRLKNEKGLWSRLSANARKTIEEEYSLEICADKWMNFLKEINEEHLSKKEIFVPDINSLNLPQIKKSDNGICREDIRMPAEGKLLSLKNNFIEPELTQHNLDLYLIRKSIKDSIVRNLPKFKGILLDLGCGEMPYRHYILANSSVTKYIGMDIENPIYQKDTKPNLFWDGKKIPIEENSIDTIMATELFEHLPDIQSVLDEINRVLKPGGMLFFTVPFLWPLHDVPYDEYRYTPFALERHLKKAGLDSIEIKPYGGWNASLAQMLGLWLNRSGLQENDRIFLSEKFFPFYKQLIETDIIPEEYTKGPMLPGFSGSAKKKILIEDCTKESSNHDAREVSKEKFKAVIVVNYFPKISETFILDQILGLLKKGLDLEIWAQSIPEEKLIHPAIIQNNLLSKVRYIQLPLDYYGNKEWKKEFLMINKITINKNDLFHVHFGQNFNALQKLFLEINNPVIVSFHGLDASEYIYHNGPACYKHLFNRADLITTPSYEMQNVLLSLGSKKEKMIVHRYGVDINKFTPKEKSPQNEISILTVARLVEKKGIQYSIRAFAELNLGNAIYKIIGDGPLETALKRLVYQLEINDRVIFLGSKSKEQIINEMRNSDIYILTSITASNGDKEGLPVTLIEAQSTGLPVVSTIHAGIPELIDNNLTGFLCEEKNIKCIAEKLKILINNSDIRKRFSKQARTRIMEEFDIEKLNNVLFNTYEKYKNNFSEGIKISETEAGFNHEFLLERSKMLKNFSETTGSSI